MSKVCTNCNKTKSEDAFQKMHMQCKDCVNEKERERYELRKNSDRICVVCNEKIPACFLKRADKVCNDCNYLKNHPDGLKKCNTCNATKHISLFSKQRNICSECRKKNDQERYQRFKNEEGTKECSVCKEVKDCKKFSPGKKYCLICLNKKECADRNANPVLKVKKNVRNRIYAVLSESDKSQKSMQYLGCGVKDYLDWLNFSNPDYFFQGNVWHIDHVVPLARFDLSKEDQQAIAFNWRNTMPLLREDNLTKKTKIDKKQIEEHYLKLQQYHTQQNTKIPKEFVELFATHLDAGIPLEPPTTTHDAERQ